MNKLKYIFEPNSIAVIGASAKDGSVGNAIFHNLLRANFKGVIFPINPKYSNVLSVKAYPKVTEVKDEVDLVIICIPKNSVLQAIKDCIEKNVKGIIVISSGFKEVGIEGEKLENKIIELSNKNNIPLIGPNCLGIVNTSSKVNLNANFAFRMPQSGNVALISQSGAIGIAALDYAHQHNLGLSKFASIGNKAVIDESDILEYLVDDESTRIIAMYVEDIEKPARFIEIANKAAKLKKPIIVIKTGRSARGAMATKSHTGALSSSDLAYDSLFAQCGVIRVETLAELFEYAKGFTCYAIPQGKRVAVLTNAGGMGIIATDAAERNKLEMATFEDNTLNNLKKILPLNSGINNPVDLGGDSDSKRFEHALSLVIKDKNVDSIVISITPTVKTNILEIAEIMADIAEKNPKKTILANLMSIESYTDFDKILEKAAIPNFDFPEVNIRVLAAMAQYYEWINQAPVSKPIIRVNKQAVNEMLDKLKKEERIRLTESETYMILNAYGMNVADFKESTTLKGVISAANEIGYPVVLKIISPDIQHKLEVGGIKIDLKNEDELIEAFEDITQNIKKIKNKVKTTGFLVQKYIAEKGIEIIAGSNEISGFGFMIMFGLGGTFVELFQDVSFRLTPLSKKDAEDMIKNTKGYQILKGFRGQSTFDIEEIIDYLLRLSKLVEDFPIIKEIEMNPIRVLEDAKGIIIMDAKAVLKEEFISIEKARTIKKAELV